MLVILTVVLSAAPTPGMYIFEGGAGTLVPEKRTFSIEVLGSNAHVCSLEGTWAASTGGAEEEGSRCEVTCAASGSELTVSATGDACRDSAERARTSRAPTLPKK